MRKKILAGLISAAAFGVNASSLDSMTITGFGSVAIGKSNNDIGYAGYTSQKVDWKQETLGALQFDFKINDKAKFVTQIVANSRYDYDLDIEMAYASYDLGLATVRAGKLRLPLFFYSDFIDLGYAYPMIRPSQETYKSTELRSYTGAELLIPIELSNSSILLQPVVGISKIDDRDSTVGKINFNNMLGLSANWVLNDFSVRASYFTAKSDSQFSSTLASECKTNHKCLKAKALDIDNKDGQFISIGSQYDNGDFMANIEGTDVKFKGKLYDSRSLSGLIGYRIGKFTPYLASGWMETTDNDLRPEPGLAAVMNFKRTSYSIGSRFDFSSNMAFKLDATFVDYKGTSGGFTTNLDKTTGKFTEKDSIVYSARLDFVF